jgi:hypothetical protein
MLAFDSAKPVYDQSPEWQRAAIAEHKRVFGIDTGAERFLRPEYRDDYRLAFDAQPQLVSTPSSGVPAWLTYYLDPDLLRVLTAKLEAADIFGEQQKGSWESTTLIFSVVERTYETKAYGDYDEGGTSGINANFPERQPFLFQTMARYGNLEIERMGLAKIGFVAEQKAAAIFGLDNFTNLTYFKGVAGLNNYGALNDPNLPAAIAPAPKAAGGIAWMSGTTVTATANEIFTDIQSLVIQSINQSDGQINLKSKFILALSPAREGAMTATNTFNVNVSDLLKKNFPNLEVKTAIQYGAVTAQNNQGSALGEVMQLWCPEAAGQKSGYCVFNTKLKSGPVIVNSSSFKQKMICGSAGFLLRQPWAMATMVGL